MLMCTHCGTTFATTEESAKHVCRPEIAKLTAVKAGDVMRAHEAVVKARSRCVGHYNASDADRAKAHNACEAALSTFAQTVAAFEQRSSAELKAEIKRADENYMRACRAEEQLRNAVAREQKVRAEEKEKAAKVFAPIPLCDREYEIEMQCRKMCVMAGTSPEAWRQYEEFVAPFWDKAVRSARSHG